MRNGFITIVAPIDDTPADRAGVESGDVILEIDGESVAGWDLFQAINRIRGEKGTPVRLLVRRKNTGEAVELEIIRDVIPLKSVRLTMLVGRIGHLRITSFSGTTLEELQGAMERFERSQGLGLIVDIRNNPGGLLSSVVDVTSQFIDEGLVLYQLDGKGNRRGLERRIRWNCGGCAHGGTDERLQRLCQRGIRRGHNIPPARGDHWRQDFRQRQRQQLVAPQRRVCGKLHNRPLVHSRRQADRRGGNHPADRPGGPGGRFGGPSVGPGY